MRRGTLLFLVALVLVLGYLALQKERERAAGGPETGDHALCPGLELERVRAVRIEHLERGLAIKLERDAEGRWFLTDPVEYPAQAGLVRALLTQLAAARAVPVEGVDLHVLGLDPPGVVLECTQVEAQGERVLRVELGGLDLDPGRVIARVPGHPAGRAVFATSRALSNTLERNPDDYRDARATGLLAQEVVAITRRGEVFQAAAGRRVPLEFEALAGPDGWKTTSAPLVTLSPDAMGLLARGASELGIERFVDDAPRDYARYGLDAPAFTLELVTLSGQRARLAFGVAPGTPEVDVGERAWFCRRDDYAHVWEVRTRDVELLTRPASLFYEQSLVRVLRDDVQRLELEGAGARRVLERAAAGWTVQELGPSDAPRFPADPAEVEAALATLERAQLAEHLREPFEPAVDALSFVLTRRDGARFGGKFGRATRDPASGAQGSQFLRDGDELVGVVGDEVLELLRRPLDRFRARRVHDFEESLVRAVELTHGGRSFGFLNDGNNVWTTQGTSLAAPAAFQLALDGLLHLATRRWLEPGEEVDAQEELAVALRPLEGERVQFRLARTADGRVLCLCAGGERAEVDPELLARLVGLFEGP